MSILWTYLVGKDGGLPAKACSSSSDLAGAPRFADLQTVHRREGAAWGVPGGSSSALRVSSGCIWDRQPGPGAWRTVRPNDTDPQVDATLLLLSPQPISFPRHLKTQWNGSQAPWENEPARGPPKRQEESKAQNFGGGNGSGPQGRRGDRSDCVEKGVE